MNPSRPINLKRLAVTATLAGALAAPALVTLATDGKNVNPAPSMSRAYPLDRCVVSGETLGAKGDPIVHHHNGRTIMFDSRQCVDRFMKAPDKYLAKVDKEIVKAQMANYPLGTCVVSGQKLGGAMGEPLDHVHDNTLVRFCCQGCVSTFNKTPGKYMSRIDEARARQSADRADDESGKNATGEERKKGGMMRSMMNRMPCMMMMRMMKGHGE